MPIKKYFCPINVTLSLIDGKWNPLILFLLKERARRFGALQAALPDVCDLPALIAVEPCGEPGHVHRPR